MRPDKHGRVVFSRSQSRAMSNEMPIGDPYGGPAYRQRTDIGGIVSDVFGGGAGIVGADIQANAARDAAGIQAGATQQGIAEQQREYDQTRADLAPFRAAGTNAIGQLQNLVGDGQSGPLSRKFSVADFWNDPVVQLGYQSGLDLGTKALRNAAPLTTGLDSGAALKELTKFGTDYTGQQAGAAQSRFVGDQGNQFNKLAALAGVGQSATNQTAQAGQNSANNVTQLIGAQGNAGAAARIAGANAWTGGLTSVANWWQQRQAANRPSIYYVNGGGLSGIGGAPLSAGYTLGGSPLIGDFGGGGGLSSIADFAAAFA